MSDGAVHCWKCRTDRPVDDFYDDDGNPSTRCRTCREAGEDTPRQTPMSRKASGKISSEEVNRLLREREAEVKRRMHEAPTDPPPPPPDSDDD